MSNIISDIISILEKREPKGHTTVERVNELLPKARNYANHISLRRYIPLTFDNMINDTTVIDNPLAFTGITEDMFDHVKTYNEKMSEKYGKITMDYDNTGIKEYLIWQIIGDVDPDASEELAYCGCLDAGCEMGDMLVLANALPTISALLTIKLAELNRQDLAAKILA